MDMVPSSIVSFVTELNRLPELFMIIYKSVKLEIVLIPFF